MTSSSLDKSPPSYIKSSATMTRYSVTVSTRGLSYAVTAKDLFGRPKLHKRVQIITGVDMHVVPGELLAIMGPSGSGKSTLLNVLAGRVNTQHAELTGQVLFRGPPPGCNVSYFSNYVMQKDIQLDFLSVEETLMLSAELKLHGKSRREKRERVESVLRELGLEECRKVAIGGPMKKGISGGQLKRVAIAVELLDDPSLLFLDEPTSGLDSALAFEVLQLLTDLARSGRTIICTVHQPRSQVFAMFDRLLLLSQGQAVYHGGAAEIVGYFERLGFSCPTQFNPADFILDLLSPRNKKGEGRRMDVIQREKEGGRSSSLVNYSATTEENHGKLHRSLSLEGGGGGGDNREDFAGVDHEKAGGRDEAEGQEALTTVSSCPSPVSPSFSPDSCQGRVYVGAEDTVQFPGKFRESAEYAVLLEHIEEQKEPATEGLGERRGSLGRLRRILGREQGGPSLWRSARAAAVICYRTTLNSYRHPMTCGMILIVNLVMGLFLGGIWFGIGNSDYINATTPESIVKNQVNNILGALFFMLVDVPFSSFHALSSFQTERVLFNRESSSRLYSTAAFFFGKSIADLPFQTVPPMMMMIIFYWMTDLAPTVKQFFIYLLVGILNCFVSISFFYVVSAIVPNADMANLLAPVVIVIFMLLAGFFLKDANIPSWIGWLRYLSWLRYAFFALAANQFPPDEKLGGIYDNYVILSDWVIVSDTRLWYNIALLFVLGVAVRIVAFVALKYCNRRVGLDT